MYFWVNFPLNQSIDHDVFHNQRLLGPGPAIVLGAVFEEHREDLSEMRLGVEKEGTAPSDFTRQMKTGWWFGT
jgi:hypothetical protein